jgi:hypothetical protein
MKAAHVYEHERDDVHVVIVDVVVGLMDVDGHYLLQWTYAADN